MGVTFARRQFIIDSSTGSLRCTVREKVRSFRTEYGGDRLVLNWKKREEKT